MATAVRAGSGGSALTIAVLLGFAACSGDSGSTGSAAPEIVGCNSVRYQGYTYGSLGCAPGIASFTVSGSQNGHNFCFDITCSGGCISGVTVCAGQQARRLTTMPSLTALLAAAPLRSGAGG